MKKALVIAAFVTSLLVSFAACGTKDPTPVDTSKTETSADVTDSVETKLGDSTESPVTDPVETDSVETTPIETVLDETESAETKEPETKPETKEPETTETADPEDIVSLGLLYSVNVDGTSCTIIGIRENTAVEVYIPKYIDGYKVTDIGEYAFDGCTALLTITFEGTVSEWNAITKGNGWNNDVPAIAAECSDESVFIKPDVLYGKGDHTILTIGDIVPTPTIGDLMAIGDYLYTYMGMDTLESTRAAYKIILEAEEEMAWADIVAEKGGGDEEVIWEMLELTESTFKPVAPQWEVSEMNTDITNVHSIYAELLGAPVTVMDFSDCTNLTSVEVPANILSVQLRNCTSLSSIEIPANVTFVNISYCTNLASVTVDTENQNFCSVDGVLFNKSMTELISYPPRKFGTSYTIPDNVTTICDNAFEDCTSLTNITISNTVTTIGECAFRGCYNLTSVTIPDGVTAIGDEAFAACYNLMYVTFDGNSQLTTIGEGAFLYCSSLTNITIPSTVTIIHVEAFLGCENLTDMTFSENSQLTIIDALAFDDCSSLTNVTIPSTVTAIYGGAFRGCENLTDMTFGENSQLTTIGWNAFEGCTSLTNIDLPDSLTDIDNLAFGGCTSLTSVRLPSSVTAIERGTFSDCTNLSIINYGGTTTQWTDGTITFYDDRGSWSWEVPWNDNTGEYTVYCTDGTVAKDGTITLNP